MFGGHIMKLTLAEPKFLKESINIISELVNEARFKVSKEAIELVAMDPANVAMVIFKLLSSSFTEYDVKKDVEIAIRELEDAKRRAEKEEFNKITELRKFLATGKKIKIKATTKAGIKSALLRNKGFCTPDFSKEVGTSRNDLSSVRISSIDCQRFPGSFSNA